MTKQDIKLDHVNTYRKGWQVYINDEFAGLARAQTGYTNGSFESFRFEVPKINFGAKEELIEALDKYDLSPEGVRQRKLERLRKVRRELRDRLNAVMMEIAELHKPSSQQEIADNSGIKEE